MNRFIIGDGLTSGDKLYRYVSFEAFVALIQLRTLRVSHPLQWADPWELIPGRVPTVNDEGTVEEPLYSFYEGILASCWSQAPESDAMWRIYSPSHTGVQIATSVAKFEQVGTPRICSVARVWYFDHVSELAKSIGRRTGPFDDALPKRRAFEHEQEVRFLTHTDFLEGCAFGAMEAQLPLDPSVFLEGIVIDPRAEGWFVDAVIDYCRRNHLPQPELSNLYAPNPHTRIGLTKKWVVVKKPT